MARLRQQHYTVTNLWTILEQRERTAAWLARKCGYTPQYFLLIRSGRKPVTETVVRRVSAFLELPVAALFAPIDSLKWDESSQIVAEQAAD